MTVSDWGGAALHVAAAVVLLYARRQLAENSRTAVLLRRTLQYAALAFLSVASIYFAFAIDTDGTFAAGTAWRPWGKIADGLSMIAVANVVFHWLAQRRRDAVN